MNAVNIFEAIGFADEKYLLHSERMETRKRKIAKKLSAFVCAAACLCIAAAGISLSSEKLVSPSPDRVSVLPDLRGYDFREARTYYAEYFDLAAAQREYSSEYPEGTIIDTFPPAGRDYLVGRTTVKCNVSLGARTVTVPDITGIDADRAKEFILSLGELKPIITFDNSDTVPEGCVISTFPAAGDKALYGSEIYIKVCKEKEVTFPDVTGMKYESAKIILEEYCGYTVGVVFENSDDFEKGTVISSAPAPGEKTRYGSAVKLTVSSGKE